MATIRVFDENANVQEIEVEDEVPGSTFGPDGHPVPPPETVQEPDGDDG